jgi:hypothetical protein
VAKLNLSGPPSSSTATTPATTRPAEAGNDGQNLTDAERTDFQWKVVQRFDVYIGATNTKAAMLLTFNTFVFGAIVLKWNEVAQYFGPFKASVLIANALLFVAAGAALAAIWFALQAVVPVLKSAKEPNRYHSMVFFGHVAEHSQPDLYLELVRSATPGAVADDLAKQAHALAQITCGKFRWLTWATRMVVFVQLPAFLGMAVTLLVAAFCLHLTGGQP